MYIIHHKPRSEPAQILLVFALLVKYGELFFFFFVVSPPFLVCLGKSLILPKNNFRWERTSLHVSNRTRILPYHFNLASACCIQLLFLSSKCSRKLEPRARTHCGSGFMRYVPFILFANLVLRESNFSFNVLDIFALD